MTELERDFRREQTDQTECYRTICSSKSYTIILVKEGDIGGSEYRKTAKKLPNTAIPQDVQNLVKNQ